MKTNTDQGLSLVEMMVVIGVIGILAALAIPSMLDLINKRRVEMTAAQLSVVQPDVPVIAVAGSRGYRLEVRINGIGRAQVCDLDGSMDGSSKRCVAL